MTKITITNEFGKYSVASQEDSLSVEDMVALFRQVMLAAAYQKGSLDDVLGEE